MFTTAKVAVQPTGSAANPFVKHLSVGEGVEGAFNVELIKNFRFLVNGMYGNGIGRYLIGLGPAYVVRPIGVSPTSFDVDTSMVHSGGGTAGFEFQLGSKTQIGTYYGGEYFQRNSFADLTAANTTGAPRLTAMRAFTLSSAGLATSV